MADIQVDAADGAANVAAGPDLEEPPGSTGALRKSAAPARPPRSLDSAKNDSATADSRLRFDAAHTSRV
ncbi:MAG: hypothetical protein ACKPJJ_09880, partial [Planctomycetaceae bacterium]